MAKLGSPDKAEYDPFKSISSSLSALATPAPPSPPATREPADKAKPRTRPTAAPPPIEEPVSIDAEPTVEDEADEFVADGSDGGGGGGSRLRQAPPRPKPVSSTSALQITKRFKTTRGEAAELDSAAIQLGAALGVSIDFSKLTRALWDVYLRHQEDILRNVPGDETWDRPANNDPVGLAALDERLADLINDGFMVACRRPRNSR